MSQQYSLTKTDLLKIGKGALIATGGALLTYLAAVVTDVNFTVNYHDNAMNLTPFATAILSILINAGWKFLEGQKSTS
jgi:hypothetical protein